MSRWIGFDGRRDGSFDRPAHRVGLGLPQRPDPAARWVMTCRQHVDRYPVLEDDERIAAFGRLLPSPEILMGPYVRLESVLSSRIEGTQTSVGQLLLFEADHDQVTRCGGTHGQARRPPA